MLKPMSSREIRSMSTKKQTTHTMLISEREVEHVINRGELVYLLVGKGESVFGRTEIQDGPISELLAEFDDVFPNDLPPGLPPIHGIEHQIDLIPGVLYQIKLLIVVIRRRPRSYKGKLVN